MLQFDRWKIIAIVLTCLVGIILALPNLFSKETVEAWPSWMPKRQMPLGLDLRGGAHLLLAMDTDELKKDWLTSLREDARKQLRDGKIGFSSVGIQGSEVQVRLVKPEEADAALKLLNKIPHPIGNALLGSSGYDVEVVRGAEPGTFILRPTAPGLQARIANASSAAIETINRRINALGTAESTVIRQGTDRIVVQYPGIGSDAAARPEGAPAVDSDPCAAVSRAENGNASGPGIRSIEDLKRLIGCTAKLTFHQVHPQVTAEEARHGHVPLGFKIFESAERDEARHSDGYVLSEVPIVQGDDLDNAQPSFDPQTNEPVISFKFNQSGARKFGAFTKNHVGEPFAIVLDNKVISAPVIREAILGGSGQISGNFTVESANNLAIQLRSGALPAKLTIVEERTVGASLGADSIAGGKLAGIVGGIAVLILTILAYGTFGIFACVGLIVHLVLTVALMTLLGSTLTLPGIAGLVLGVAMAVDANVLIYERIREELRAGRTPIAAIDTGFQRAFITIADSQLTTLACALIMFWLGSGPIRGFAVTLTIGILTSIFASVTVVRLLIWLWLKAQPKGRIATVPV